MLPSSNKGESYKKRAMARLLALPDPWEQSSIPGSQHLLQLTILLFSILHAIFTFNFPYISFFKCFYSPCTHHPTITMWNNALLPMKLGHLWDWPPGVNLSDMHAPCVSFWTIASSSRGPESPVNSFLLRNTQLQEPALIPGCVREAPVSSLQHR